MPSNPSKQYGAAGVGHTTSFDIEIDEAHDDPGDMRMSISTRGWSLRFALSSRNDAARMLSFLREHMGRLVFSEFVIGSFHHVPVRLIKDNEFADRFWIRAHTDGHMVDFVFAGKDLTEFTDALAQAVDDLRS